MRVYLISALTLLIARQEDINYSTTTTTVLQPFIWVYQAEPVREEQNILDFDEAEMMGWQWHQLNHAYASNLHLAPDR